MKKLLAVIGVGLSYALILGGCSLLILGSLQNFSAAYGGFIIALLILATVTILGAGIANLNT